MSVVHSKEIIEDYTAAGVVDQEVLYHLSGNVQVSARILGAPPAEAQQYLLFEQGSPHGGSSIDPEYARDEGVRVLVPDRPGYGKSTPSKHLMRPVDNVVGQHALILQCERESSRAPVAAVGRSAGGVYAAGAVALYPGLFDLGAVVGGIMPHNAVKDHTAGMTDDNQKAHSSGVSIEELTEKYERLAAEVRGDPLTIMRGLLNDTSLLLTDRVLIRNYMDQMGGAQAKSLQPGARGWLEDILALRMPLGYDPAWIAKPMVVWHGDEDRLSPPAHGDYLVSVLCPDRTHNMTHVAGEGHFGGVAIIRSLISWMRGPNPALFPPAHPRHMIARHHEYYYASGGEPTW